MSDTIIAYVTRPDKSIVTETYNLGNVSHKKNLLLLLNGIANGLEKGMRITFSTEL